MLFLRDFSQLSSNTFHYEGNNMYLFKFTSLKEGEDQKEITIEPAQALDEVEPLPEDCYTRPISLPEGMCLF